MFVLKTLVSPGLLTPAAQWWFIIGVTLVVFFVLLALVLLWVAWQSLRATPDQREVGDDGLLGLVSGEPPPAAAPALAAELPVGAPLPAPSVPAAPAEPPPPALRATPAPAPSGAGTEDIAAYWSENSAPAASSPASHAAPVLPVEIRPRVTSDQPVRPPAPEVGLHSEAAALPAPDAVTKPLAPSPADEVAPAEGISPPPGLLAEDIRAQLAQPPASPPAPPKTTGPLGGRPTGSLFPPPPPPVPEPETIPNPPRAGLTERLPVQRKSLRPPAAAPKATPQDEAAPHEPAPVTPAASVATTAVIAAAETMALKREAMASAVTDPSHREASAPAGASPAPPPPLPVQHVPAVRPQPAALPQAGMLPQAGAPAASSVAPPRFLADDRPTGIRRETAWLGVSLVVYAVVLGGLVVVFFPTVRNWLLPPAWAERVAAIPRAMGLESPPPPPLPVKQVEVRQYANAYSSAPKGAGGKVVRMVTIAGLVKNITSETLYELRAEIELYPRQPEGAPPERRTIYLVPNRLEPQQEGRYTLTVADAEYRQSSLKRIVTGDGRDMKEVPAVFVQGMLTPPDEAETKPSPASPAVPNRQR
ncbi:hypothetical protein J8C02_08310 [Chloracidobacterium sp. MS 40/45]|uniref:hypothetical protein n=1 Tax=Chloracidobacterium aggregatum TaxID=2851959 RepID=UPI001B8AE7D2|nr:hypothetical protein [Chloracidobacterium aggregatum]QUV99425.1 hypothetical protein J8C02_08310 [Chloracidobacterium sp. MS 40/45]